MASLDSILGVLVPIIIFIFVVFIFASPFKKQIREFWDWLTEKITRESGGKEPIDPMIPQNIIYER